MTDPASHGAAGRSLQGEAFASGGTGSRTGSALAPSRDVLAVLRRPATIRARCAAITRAASDDRSANFRIDRSRLDEAARRVDDVIRRRFPDLNIPLHSRWRHFEAGGVDRRAELDALLAGRTLPERAHAWFDLTVVSVLLDAGAGSQWSYVERGDAIDAAALPASRHSRDDLLSMLDRSAAGNGAAPASPAAVTTAAADEPQRYARSEGLGVASFRAFVAGAFSSTDGDPLRVDAQALRHVDVAALRAMFQVSATNPLVGLEGRAGLMNRLGEALQHQAAIDGCDARPALVYDRLTDRGTRMQADAGELLQLLLRTLTSIWRSGSIVMGVPGGDVWPHRWAGADTGGGSDRTSGGWVPFHKLTQWLTYSLLEPLQWAGVRVDGVEALTGLPEYRNGGLLLDTGVIVPRSAHAYERRWKPSDEFVIEWRALTVTLLDELAELVRRRLGVDAEQMPLACILEGGTWAAGREIAQELRGGAPPLAIDSDGTVF